MKMVKIHKFTMNLYQVKQNYKIKINVNSQFKMHLYVEQWKCFDMHMHEVKCTVTLLLSATHILIHNYICVVFFSTHSFFFYFDFN